MDGDPAEPSRARACTAREVQIGQPQTFSAIRDPFLQLPLELMQ
jgi:hypothetical protein